MAYENRLIESVYEYLTEEEDGASSEDIAKRFLKIPNPPSGVAEKAVYGVLEKDGRFLLDKGFWKVNTETSEKTEMNKLSDKASAVYLITGGQGHEEKILHISAFRINPGEKEVLSEWLVEPDMLLPDTRNSLMSSEDSEFSGEYSAVLKIRKYLSGSLPVFVAYRQQRMLRNLFEKYGEFLNERYLLMNNLLKLDGLKAQRKGSVDDVYRKVFNFDPPIHSAISYGRALSEAANELLERVEKKYTPEEIEYGPEKQRLQWQGEELSYERVSDTPAGPGVYGFKDKKGEYIYIGKAADLSRRLKSYFIDTDETPSKLEYLRENAESLTVHECGSELEAVIYEYRLIRKYSPKLNTQHSIRERRGRYEEIEDSVIMLPGTAQGEAVIFWYKRGEKIEITKIRSDSPSEKELADYASEFFFSGKNKPGPSDFPERELALRWIKNNYDTLDIIPVNRMSGQQQVAESIMNNYKAYTELSE